MVLTILLYVWAVTQIYLMKTGPWNYKNTFLFGFLLVILATSAVADTKHYFNKLVGDDDDRNTEKKP